MFKISQFKNTKTLIGLVYVCPVDSHFVIDYKVLTAFCWSSSGDDADIVVQDYQYHL